MHAACCHRRKGGIGKGGLLSEKRYDSCPSNNIKIVLGDWNAKVGRKEIYQGVGIASI